MPSSSSVALVILNLLLFLTLTQSHNIWHLLNYHIFREFEGGGELEVGQKGND